MGRAPPVRPLPGALRRALLWVWVFVGTACGSPAMVEVEGGRASPSAAVLDGGVAELVGEWGLWRGALVPSGEVPGTPEMVTVPGGWTPDPLQEHPGFGVGTYVLQLDVPPSTPSSEPLALYMRRVYTAAEVEVDGALAARVGRVGREASAAEAYLEPRILPLPVGAEQVEVRVRVSNFHHRVGGLRRAWLVGTHSQVSAHLARSALGQGLLTAFLGMMGLLYLLVYGVERRDPGKLWFAAFSLATAVRTAAGGDGQVLTRLLPELPWSDMLRLEFGANFLAPALGLAVVERLYPEATFRWGFRSVQVGALVLALSVVILPTVQLTGLVPLVGVFILGAGAAGVATLIRAVLQRAPDAQVVLAGFALLIVAAGHDNLRGLGVIDSRMELVGLGFCALVLAQALILSKQFADSLTQVERLSEDLRQSHAALVRTHDAVLRFVPFEFLELLGKPSIVDVRRGDHVAIEVEVLFCDVRGFTTLVEGLSPSDAFGLVNDWLARMEPHIHDQGGFIKEYLGDCIVALFPSGPDAAIAACVGMQTSLREYARIQQYAPGRPFEAGMGLHAGPLVMGTIGGDDRLDTGTVGDVVNATSRIEGLTRRYGAALIISEHSRSRLVDAGRWSLRELDTVSVKGKAETLRIYEVLDALPNEQRRRRLATRARYEAALHALQAGDREAARAHVDACLAEDPEDLAAQLLRERTDAPLLEG